MNNLLKRLKKLEEMINLNNHYSDSVWSHNVFTKIYKWMYGSFDKNSISKEDLITEEEWSYYVNYLKDQALKENRDLNELEKDIEIIKNNIKAKGGFSFIVIFEVVKDSSK